MAEWLRRNVRWLALAVFAATAVGSVWQSEVNHNRRSRLADIAQCERVNLVRSLANRNGEIIHDFASLIAASSRASAQVRRGRDREIVLSIARQYAGFAADARYTPLTNCRMAVDHPDTYVAPKPRPFPPAKIELPKRNGS